MTVRTLIQSRHLAIRVLRHVNWRLSGGKFAMKRNSSIPAVVWLNYECPVVNHPTQVHLLDSKLFNMQIAVDCLNNLIIEPGQIFSFWKLIGRPSASAGFKSGPTFENGTMVTSYGGGLCQISGLVFNLALEAGCEILERSSHSLDAYGERRYLPLGRDATVAWISKDLAFRNTTGVPLRLHLNVETTRATGRIEGFGPKPFHVKIERNEFRSDRSDSETTYFDAVITRSISVDKVRWVDAGRFSSQYRMLESTPHADAH